MGEKNEMPYIYESRTIIHDAGPDMRFQLKEFLMQEVDRAWAENCPCGKISCEWNEDAVTVTVKSGDMDVSRVRYAVVVKYTVVNDANYYVQENKGEKK